MARPGKLGQPIVDRYTWGHAAVGTVYGVAGLPWYGAAALAVAWELVENPIKDAAPELFPEAWHDRPANAIADAVAVMAGWWLGNRIRRR